MDTAALQFLGWGSFECSARCRWIGKHNVYCVRSWGILESFLNMRADQQYRFLIAKQVYS
jgi:hypothetical protein